MFIQTRPIKLYSMKLTTDLAMRSDDLNGQNYVCPMSGMNDVVLRYYNKETVAGLDLLFEQWWDFDADKIRPVLDESYVGELSVDEFKELVQEEATTISYNPKIHKLNFNYYYRRIEDIHENYLRTYLGNVVYNIKNKTGGVRDFEKNHKDSWSFVSDGDNGEDVTESSDLLFGPQIDMSEVATVQEAMRNLPFTVKRLWYFSCIMKINVLQYIQSYLIAKEKNDYMVDNNSTSAKLKYNDVIRVGVTSCNKQGYNIRSVSVTDKNIWAKSMFIWITGESSIYKSYYKNYRDFLVYCRILNIDLKNDDLSKYDKQFVDSLIVTTVTPNDQYNALVADSIRRKAIDNGEEAELISESPIDYVYNTMRNYNNYIMSTPDEQHVITNMSTEHRKNIERAAKYIFSKYYSTYRGVTVDLSKVDWINGFMCYKGDIVLIPLNFIHDKLGDDNKPYLNYGLISESGSFIKLSSAFTTYRIILMNIYNYITNKDTFVEVTRPKWDELKL